MEAFNTLTKRVIREDEGQDMVEYVLIFGLVSIVAIPILIALGPIITDLWQSCADTIANAF